MKRGKLILLLLTLGGLSVFAFFVVHSVVETATVVVPNAYALEWAAVFVIEHMEVNENSLAKADPKNDPPFRALWLSDGTNSHWEEFEPNRKILEYLLNKTAV